VTNFDSDIQTCLQPTNEQNNKGNKLQFTRIVKYCLNSLALIHRSDITGN